MMDLLSYPRGKRSRTGCLTCRKRRKKCDEQRPNCFNCQRNNIACHYYQTGMEWSPVRNRKSRKISFTAASASSRSIIRLRNGDQSEEQEGEEDASSSPPSPALSSSEGQQTQAREREGSRSSFNISFTLPPLIEGVQTAMERRLFHHFASVFSQNLATSTVPAQISPIASVILNLSLSDKGLLALTLSISACHLVQAIVTTGSNENNSNNIPASNGQYHSSQGT